MGAVRGEGAEGGVNYTDDNTNAGTLLDEDNQVDNARYTFDESSWTWKSQAPVYYKDAETNIDLYAYYPYGNPKSVTEYAFEVQQDQSGKNANEGYAMSDFLWGKVLYNRNKYPPLPLTTMLIPGLPVPDILAANHFAAVLNR